MSKSWDWLLFTQVLALGAISLLIIFSISPALFRNQLLFWVIGIGVFIFFANFDPKFWESFSTIFFVISLIVLFLLFFVANPVRGSVRWIDFGFFRFQPSEVAKISSILLLANFFKDRSADNLKNLIISFLLIFPAVVLVLIEPDIGNALTFLAIWLGITAASGFRLKHFLFLSLLSIILFTFLFEFMAPYQKKRIESFINPGADPLGTGYHIIQSKIAAGSGEFIGRGLGRGSQSSLKFLPEAESDFIFASTSEQLGFLGSGLVVALYIGILVRMIGFARGARRFGQLVIVGSVSFLILQFFINIGMNLALIPVTGITLPLVSYGGSSLISTLFVVGLVFSNMHSTLEA